MSMNVTAILVTTLAPTMKAHLSVGVMKDIDWKEAQSAMVCCTVLLGAAVSRLDVYNCIAIYVHNVCDMLFVIMITYIM